MFEKAIRDASQYTKPIVVSHRKADGETASDIGTFIVLNDDGWILTANHIMQTVMEMMVEQNAYADYVRQESDIKNNHRFSNADKIREINKIAESLPDNPITNCSMWLGRDDWQVSGFTCSVKKDLAIGQIQNFSKDSISVYPEFRGPSDGLEIGKNLCRLGFPFHKIKPTYDEEKGFMLPPNALPIPFFPIDGIYTRTVILEEDDSIKFIETSSPGLSGQSGGPIFDTDGRIWALQSHTNHYPLGFDKNKDQFLNCGVGTHVETIVDFLSENKVRFNQQAN